MSKKTIFVDGGAGTTGLRIRQRLAQQGDIALLTLPEAHRKDLHARVEAIHSADLSFLCLPDSAAKEVAAAAGADARICDTSTAHRTTPAWVYGFAELQGQREKIQAARQVAVPGCHATGFIALIAPLVAAGALPASSVVACHSITGYSGGGKEMIAAYADTARPAGYASPREYGLSLCHKHLPEMQTLTGLASPPLFTPIVADYYAGLLVSVPLPVSALASGWQSQQKIATLLADYYAGQPLITTHAPGTSPPDGTLAANALAGRDDMEIFVLGNEQQLLLCARFDNLGKGASGAAVQCMNLMLGRAETAGLVLA